MTFLAGMRRMLLNHSWHVGVVFCLVVGLAGCDGKPVSKPVDTSTKPTSPATSKVDRPLLEGWDKPAAALLLSGEQHGYLEPCGCSITQSGGLARRAQLERMLREKGWPLAGLDVGGTLKRSRRQDQVKFEAILAGLKELGYQAVAAGDSELRLAPDYLIGQFSDGVPLSGLLLSSNVVLFGAPDLGVPKPWRVVTVGDVKIGVVAVVGKSVAESVAPAGVQNHITISDATEAITSVLPLVDAEQPTFKILLAHGSLEEGQALAEKFPQFAAVLTAGGPEEPSEKPTQIGSTWLLQTGHKGKHVGVLGYYPALTPPWKWELVNLDSDRFQGDPRMEALMKSYQQQLQELDLARSDELLTKHPSGQTFIGAERCGECHTKAFAKWKTSKHAHAFESLSKGRKGQESGWVSRVYDPECLCCHVTGWDPQNVQRFDSGYLDAQTSSLLLGQQCENCHGPGSSHEDLELQYRKDIKSVDRDALVAARAALKLNSATAEQQVCAKCHDPDNSPGFKFAKYWDEVKHPWKD